MNKKAESAVNKFLSAWQKKNYLKMYKYSQLTWQSTHQKGDMHKMFQNNELLEFEIVKQFPQDPNLMTFDFQVKVKISYKVKDDFIQGVLVKAGIKEPVEKTIETLLTKVRVIPEIRPYKTDENGIFGVNPISVLRHDN